ncbi:Uncharacterised protein [uncultured archaeon]|nr:Uncharacterised protein [uncultured archaeon]
MLNTINPRLRRTDVMLNGIHSCISNTSEEFSWTPEMSMPKMVSQPWMLLQKSKGTVTFKQLKSSTNTHSCWHFNKQMDMINTDMQFINFEPMFFSSFSDKSFTIYQNTEKLEGVHCILRFPDKMESILSEGMFKSLQVHFFAPQTVIRNNVLTMFDFNLVQEGGLNPSWTTNSQELNLAEGNSSLCLKAEVSLPWM